MTHEEINNLETRDYIFKIGDRGKGIQARYDENTDTLIFPRAPFDYVCELLKEALSQEPKSGKWIDYRDDGFVECPFCGHATTCEDNIDELHYCFNCGCRMESEG